MCQVVTPLAILPLEKIFDLVRKYGKRISILKKNF